MKIKIKGILKKLAGPIIIMSVFSALAIGCATSECYDNQNSLPLAGFYSSQEVPVAISLDSISILGIGAPGDSILQDSVRSLSQVYLPFRIDQNSTTYQIRYLGGLPGVFHMADEITFIYEIEPMFVSSACGTVYYYKMVSIDYTQAFIDSVTCPSGVITNENLENIKIYFRVSTEEEVPE